MSTVGLNEATIAKYIREQESHDIALDKLGVKGVRGPLQEGVIRRFDRPRPGQDALSLDGPGPWDASPGPWVIP